ncbi:MAG: FAD-binding oxidoreductase, partial [Gammaproteobacteria bacterium]|nr:FAD-binding oxidoreductase [Gammaproteobacteria bacterium]
MIYSSLSPIQFNDPLPDSVDVVIIGAGVIGISTAWFLSKRGISVLVCDKGRVAGEQSSRNWGWIRQQGRDPAELPIMMDSINTWQSLSKECDDDIGFTRKGVLYVAENDREMAEHEQWMDIANQHQLDTQLLSGAEVDELIQDKPGQWKGGMFTPSDARAEPFKAVPALARGLRKQGGLIRENCAVRSIDMQGGQVTGVITEQGSVKAQSVVCAGGVWSTVFLANLGINLPQV